MRALSIAWKDIRHTYRDVAALAMMLVAPLLLAGALGMAFGAGDDFSIASVDAVVADLDTGEAGEDQRAGAIIVAALNDPDLADILDVTTVPSGDAARAAVDQDEADVAVIVPAGLTEGLMDTAAGRHRVEIYKDPAVTVGPAIAAAVVRSTAQSLEGARAAALAVVQLAMAEGITDPAELTYLAAETAAAYGAAAPAAAPRTLEVRAPTMPGGEDRADPNVAGQVLVGMMIFFMFFGAATPARSILDEHRQGTLFRLFSTPTSRSVILGGKYIAVFVVVLLQSIILLLVGRFLLGAQWGEAGPVTALTLSGALVATSLGLLTVSFAKTPGQAGAVSSAIFVFLGLIGGNFVGSVNVGGAFALVRRFTPNGWLMEGWSHVMYGGSWAGVAMPCLAALAFSVVFFGLATWFFGRRYA